jgi:hypothetical protein
MRARTHTDDTLRPRPSRESWHDGTYSHSWGASAIVGVAWGVMGVHQTAPGFQTLTVMPKLGGLQHAAMTVPTLRGPVAVKAAAAPAALEVAVPCGSAATLCLPRSARDGGMALTPQSHRLLLDGVEVAAVATAGHLCTARGVSCGAGGAARSLAAHPRTNHI